MKSYILAIIAIICGISSAFFFNNDFMKAPESKIERLKRRLNGRNVTVHLIPHSHDDVGWTKTVDQYFSGSGN